MADPFGNLAGAGKLHDLLEVRSGERTFADHIIRVVLRHRARGGTAYLYRSVEILFEYAPFAAMSGAAIRQDRFGSGNKTKHLHRFWPHILGAAMAGKMNSNAVWAIVYRGRADFLLQRDHILSEDICFFSQPPAALS